MPLLGAHISVAGGLDKAPERGMAIGCQAMQIFTKNQMQWHAEPLSQEEIQKYRKNWQEVAHTYPVLSHDAYLINLGSPEPEKLEKSRTAFLDEMDRAEALGIKYLVFHPGAHLNKVSEQECLRIIADSLNLLLAKRPDDQLELLIENTAGQGSNVGYRFEQVAEILEQVKYPKRVGVCFDTCHALVAGYDFRTKVGYESVMSEFDRIIGLERLKAFHLNDAKKGLSSRVDRHESIGKGHVGLEAFQCLLNDKRFAQTPMVLETPAETVSYQDELHLLNSLIVAHVN
jgi:deoxyribonuclease IV